MPRKKAEPKKAKAAKPKVLKKAPAKKPVAKPVKKEKPATRTKQNRRTKTVEKEIERLVEVGKKAGKLDQRQVFEVIPDTPQNADILDDLYSELAENEVELIPATEP